MKMLVLFMGRSGGHALVRWIANGLPGIVMFHSNCVGGWQVEKLTPNKIVVEKAGSPDDGVHIMKTIEDFHLPLWHDIKAYEDFDHAIGVIRSPRNWLASSIKIGGWANDYLDEAPKDCNHLPVSRIEAHKCYLWERIVDIFVDGSINVINYDLWLTSEQYKRMWANQLGIKDTEYPEQCKFSSFKRPFNHTEDRTQWLNKKQLRRFDKLYDQELQDAQEKWWTK